MLVTALQHFLERHKDSNTRSKARDEILFDEVRVNLRLDLPVGALDLGGPQFLTTTFAGSSSIRAQTTLFRLSPLSRLAKYRGRGARRAVYKPEMDNPLGIYGSSFQVSLEPSYA